MNASDLCLIIDNTQEYLRDWLHLAGRHKSELTPKLAESHFRFRMSTLLMGRGSLRKDVLNLVTERLDWQEVADHYNLKAKEGTTAPREPTP